MVSVDIDRGICELFAYRQRRERHLLPSRIVCCDLLDDTLPAAGFDIVTAVGSTLREIGVERRDDAVASLARLVAPRGQLLLHGEREAVDSVWACEAIARCDLQVADLRVDEQLPGAPQVLVRASR